MWEGREKALNTIKQELVCEVNDTRHRREKLGRRDKNGSCSVIWARTMSHLWTTIQQSIIFWLLFQGDKKTLHVTWKALCTKRDLGGRKGILLAKWMHLSMKSTKNSTSVSLKTLPMEDATLNMENGQQKLLQILQSWANDLCSKFKERAPFVLVSNLCSVLWNKDTFCVPHISCFLLCQCNEWTMSLSDMIFVSSVCTSLLIFPSLMGKIW